MNFLIFGDFLNLFFIFKEFKTIKNMQKDGIFLRGTHVDATWHARPRGRAT